MKAIDWETTERMVLIQGRKERLAAFFILLFPLCILLVLLYTGAPPAYTIPLSAFCLICTALLLGSKHEIILDRQSRSLEIRKTVLWRAQERAISWDEGASLSMETVVGGGSSHTTINYTIFFATRSGEAIALLSSMFEQDAMDGGAEIAEFMGMPLQQDLKVHRKELTPRTLMLRMGLLFGGVILALVILLVVMKMR